MNDSEDYKTAGSTPTSPTFPKDPMLQPLSELEETIARLSTVHDIMALHKHKKYQDLHLVLPVLEEPQEQAVQPSRPKSDLDIAEALETFHMQSVDSINLFVAL